MQSSHIFTLLILFVWSQITEAQNQAPVISNISALADTVFHTLKVHYNLSDLENDTSEVIMAASADGGITYCLNVSGAAGDVGPGIPVGNNRYFEWQYPDSLSAMVGDFQIQLNAVASKSCNKGSEKVLAVLRMKLARNWLSTNCW